MIHNNYKVEIFCYFENLETVRLRFIVNKNLITEEIFFSTIFRGLTRDELMEIYKISCCQQCDDESEGIPFIREKSKIFFDGSDEHSSRILEIKNRILLEN